MRVVALLPMKGHSERVPGKNFRLFAGKPLFRWILDTLSGIDMISEIVINTDARDLLASHGLDDRPPIKIRDRAERLRGDSVSMNLVLADDIENVSADLYLMTHTTNPLLRPQTIKRAIADYSEAASKGKADSLFAVNRFQTRFYKTDGTPINHDPARLVPTQELEPWYEENSNLYLFTRESFRATRARIGKRPLLFETSRAESVDIDDLDGWHLAESLAHSTLKSG